MLVSLAKAKFPTCSTDLVWTVGLLLETQAQPVLSGRFKVWTEALPKFGKEKEARSLNGAFTDVLSHTTQMSVQVTLGCGRIVLFLLASTGLADTTDYAGRGQEQQG